MNKKAQGISINVIIIAAIALLVLVILSVIFMGRMGTFTGGVKDCELSGGKCLVSCPDPADATTSDYNKQFDVWVCKQAVDGTTTNVCCVKGG